MGLQKFIENNIGKVYGDKYLYENIIVNTRYCSTIEPHTIEVAISLPWGRIFRIGFDEREVKDNIDFYKYLTESFFPLAKKQIEKPDFRLCEKHKLMAKLDELEKEQLLDSHPTVHELVVDFFLEHFNLTEK